MTATSKGRATSYSDFYKGAAQTAASKQPGYGIPEKPVGTTQPKPGTSQDSAAELRKQALKRRLRRTASAMKDKSKKAR